MVNINGQQIKSPLSSDLVTVGDVINRVTTFAIPLAAIILFFVLLYGGYDVLMSRGSPEKIKTGRMKITAGIIGLVLMLFAYLITRIISGLFGIGEGLF